MRNFNILHVEYWNFNIRVYNSDAKFACQISLIIIMYMQNFNIMDAQSWLSKGGNYRQINDP